MRMDPAEMVLALISIISLLRVQRLERNMRGVEKGLQKLRDLDQDIEFEGVQSGAVRKQISFRHPGVTVIGRYRRKAR
jgi:hypothetical protein